MLFFIISDLLNQFQYDMKHFILFLGEILQKNYYFQYINRIENLVCQKRPGQAILVIHAVVSSKCYKLQEFNLMAHCSWWGVHCLDLTFGPGLNKELANYGQDHFILDTEQA